jgi:hypothetical protein
LQTFLTNPFAESKQLSNSNIPQLERLSRLFQTKKQQLRRQIKVALIDALLLANFGLDALPAFIVLITTAFILYRSLPLVRSEGPEEQARAQKVLVGCIVAGVLMAVAKPVAFWVTGWNVTTMQAGLPTELITVVDNLLQLLSCRFTS